MFPYSIAHIYTARVSLVFATQHHAFFMHPHSILLTPYSSLHSSQTVFLLPLYKITNHGTGLPHDLLWVLTLIPIISQFGPTDHLATKHNMHINSKPSDRLPFSVQYFPFTPYEHLLEGRKHPLTSKQGWIYSKN